MAQEYALSIYCLVMAGRGLSKNQWDFMISVIDAKPYLLTRVSAKVWLKPWGQKYEDFNKFTHMNMMSYCN